MLQTGVELRQLCTHWGSVPGSLSGSAREQLHDHTEVLHFLCLCCFRRAVTPRSLGSFGKKAQRESSTKPNEQIFTGESVEFTWRSLSRRNNSFSITCPEGTASLGTLNICTARAEPRYLLWQQRFPAPCGTQTSKRLFVSSQPVWTPAPWIVLQSQFRLFPSQSSPC